jgi:hypothetical protein
MPVFPQVYQADKYVKIYIAVLPKFTKKRNSFRRLPEDQLKMANIVPLNTWLAKGNNYCSCLTSITLCYERFFSRLAC